MGELSKALAAEESFQHAGKTYKLAPLTFEVMAFYEQYLEDRAWSALERQRRRFSPAEYAQKEQSLLEAIASGAYSFFTPACAAAFNGHVLSPGFRKMLTLRLQAANEDITDSLVDEILEAQADRVLHLMQKQDAPDPNSQTPADAGCESKPSSPDSASAA